MSGTVYMITNEITKLSYIGCTKKNIESRMAEHRYQHKNGNSKFYINMKKYGFENFTYRVLYDNIPEKLLNSMERWCIANYDTFNNGYNSNIGGNKNIGYKHTDEFKKRISNILKGRNKIIGRQNKICFSCKKNKCIHDFYKNKSRNDGFCHICKYCDNTRRISRSKRYE